MRITPELSTETTGTSGIDMAAAASSAAIFGSASLISWGASRMILVCLSNRTKESRYSLRRRCRGLSAFVQRLLGKLLCEPKVVVLPRPVEVDLAGAHCLERTLHAERA